jgi:hypothetical protein
MNKRYFRHLIWIFALVLSPFCFGQVIRIRVVNSETGHSLRRQPISVSMLYDKNDKTPGEYDAILYLETDANGEAQFGLPDPAPAHLAAQVHLTSGLGIVTAWSSEPFGFDAKHFRQFPPGSRFSIER